MIIVLGQCLTIAEVAITLYSRADSNVNLICCHINSSAREAFGNKTPFEMFSEKSEEKLLELLSLFPDPPDEVTLTPMLLNLKTR